MIGIDKSTILSLIREKLLEIKDRDLRIVTLEQARTAVDRGIHIGGAFSCMIPLVALYYGQVIKYDAKHPTAEGQDLFVLSKGHAVAALASVYADLGIIDEKILHGSRSWDSILNGHPGPLLPGIHTATGPMGQGIAVAQGLAVAGNLGRKFDVFTITGDGELQEGMAWEAIMYSGAKGLSNLCVIVDNNQGQLDDPTSLHVDMSGLRGQFEAFGWNAMMVDSTRYPPILDALFAFKYGPRDGRPTAIIARSRKGFGGMSVQMRSHKTTLDDHTLNTEISYQRRIREARVTELGELIASAGDDDALEVAISLSHSINLELRYPSPKGLSVVAMPVTPQVVSANPRDKRIASKLLRPEPLDPKQQYTSDHVVRHAMRVYAQDQRVASVDADLSSTSGLSAGISDLDIRRTLNVGVAEANMMAIGEAFALLGYNAWVSTFCPFFNWNVLRKIAVSQQERLEVMSTAGGWLTEGHGLDLTFLATASNLETQTNGATHMGNDDIMAFRSVAHLKIIDVSCPQQLLGVIRWIMDGNRGLVYVRVMRKASAVLYPETFEFQYGRAFTVVECPEPRAIIVTGGREVHEAVEASRLLAKSGLGIRVIDMPSIDPSAFSSLAHSGLPVFIPEQNNGYISASYYEYLGANRFAPSAKTTAINAKSEDGALRFIHSGTYEELVRALGLSAELLSRTIAAQLSPE